MILGLIVNEECTDESAAGKYVSVEGDSDVLMNLNQKVNSFDS